MRIISRHEKDDPWDVGGVAVSVVPDGYEGPCTVTLESGFDRREHAVLPNVQVAESVACYAVSYPDGGFARAQIDPAPGATVTHATLVDWICQPLLSSTTEGPNP